MPQETTTEEAAPQDETEESKLKSTFTVAPPPKPTEPPLSLVALKNTATLLDAKKDIHSGRKRRLEKFYELTEGITPAVTPARQASPKEIKITIVKGDKPSSVSRTLY